ncbi:MAG TPA: class I SAM-dependent methyltransferase [Steroidobacteraceae bacterium]|jgi:SAM-dependent methyltransferase
MTDWLEVWERKGRTETTDLRTLDGFENTTIDPQAVARQIVAILGLGPGVSVLEVGCGAGMLAQYIPGDYTGVDYSPAMVKKFLELQPGRSARVSGADRLPFADRSFDKVFAFSVFQYFPDAAYARAAVSEMKRVAREVVFIGDLPERSHSPDHRLYTREQFAGWQLSPGFYNPDRFNAFLALPAPA